MARRRRPTEARPPRARAAAVPLPRRKERSTPAWLLRLAPSRRSLAAGAGLVLVAAGLYAVARQTSAFAISRLELSGAPVSVRHQVRHALGPLLGTNLLALDGGVVASRSDALPTVVSVSYDRAFPHTLRVHIVPERTVAVLHRGKETWLVSARGRVIQRVAGGAHPALPRIWVPRKAEVAVGGFLVPGAGGTAAHLLALAGRFPARIATVSLVRGELVFRLRSGFELRLGEPTDVRLKLAIARRALRRLPAGATYVDVSVPGRPVAGPDNPQLSTTG